MSDTPWLQPGLARKLVVILTAGAVAAGLGGCAGGLVSNPEWDRQSVQSRAQERWDALVAKDYGKAYSLLSPGTRQVTSLEAYRQSVSARRLVRAKVAGVECRSAEVCSVAVEVAYRHKGMTISTPLGEQWVKSDGEWWAAAK